jgi:hypothetical protein
MERCYCEHVPFAWAQNIEVIIMLYNATPSAMNELFIVYLYQLSLAILFITSYNSEVVTEIASNNERNAWSS